MNRDLLTVDEAFGIVLNHLLPRPVESLPLGRALGRILRAPVLADRDQPPFDRATMDGIAFSRDAWEAGCRRYRIEGIQAAGEPQKPLANAGAGCLRIMTGAMLPEGCHVIIPSETVRIHGDIADVSADATWTEGQHIHRMGVDRKAGEILLPDGVELTPPRLAIAASAGLTEVSVSRPPRVTIIGTGDEIVSLGQPAAPYQIRPSNAVALAAGVRAAGCDDVTSAHVGDDADQVRSCLEAAVNGSDLVLISGGMSQGLFDHVPRTLEAIGVKKHFHRVAQKPGKPLWFGIHLRGVAVFGLPGNPVSTLVCFHRYVLPWLRRSLGANLPPQQTCRLEHEARGSAPLTGFLPATCRSDDRGRLLATALPYHGSGDLASLAESDGFIEIPADFAIAPAGAILPFHRWT